MRRRVQRLEQGSRLAHGIAWMIASRELFVPISYNCTLMATHRQIFQECCPIIKVEDGPRELGAGHATPPPTPRNSWSQGDSLIHDFAQWQAQDPQQDRLFTQQVETSF